MRCVVAPWLIVGAVLVVAIVAVPGTVSAQEATISGSVVDTSGGVLPGVTVTAVHDASGVSVVVVTDGRGGFRIPVRVGANSVTAELQGFAAVTQPALSVLVGQQLVLKIEMPPATLQETLTVTGDAPLINVTQSILNTNIDPRQVSELPVNGRNWLDLTMLAAGSRLNAVGELPAAAGNFQLNLDGQQVTQNDAPTFGQPRYSQDAIAEFEFVANRFDAAQGRSGGVQVNAITKSGTNTFAGTVASFFRDERFNAADFIVNRVLPYSDQQVSTTFGGPIVRDRFHFFGNYEYERQPQTFTYDSPYPTFNIDQSAPNIQHKAGARLDYQFSSHSRLAMRGANYDNAIPYDPRWTGGATRHPSSAIRAGQHSSDANVILTQVLGNRATNEVRTGWAAYYWTLDSLVRWPNHPNAYQGITYGAPLLNLQGYAIGQTHQYTPQDIGQDLYSLRDDFGYSYNKGGRHTLKTGGELLFHSTWNGASEFAQGVYDATLGPRPANLEALFPVWNDVSTWNLNALNPLIRTYTLGIGDFRTRAERRTLAGWVQDDWTVTQKLTLNLGLRYDYANNLFGEDVTLQPFLQGGRISEKNDFGPRFGFAYSVADKTVLRGGIGKYYTEVGATSNLYAKKWLQQTVVQVLNDGRADFATNPFNGPAPTFQQVVASGYRRQIAPSTIAGPDAKLGYAYQGSVGVQRQLGETISAQADFVYTATRRATNARNINLSYNPATGGNYPFTDVARLPYPGFATVLMNMTDGASNYRALQMALTKRLSNRWQASATYTLSREMMLQTTPLNPGCTHPMTVASGSVVCNVPITLAPDLAEEWYRSGEQAHRVVFNGIWDLGYGFQASGLYFYADNGWDTASAGVDARVVGSTAGRLRANGTLIPRNGLNRADLHRVDLRLQKRFQLAPKVSISGIVDVFNAFNHANYGSYVTNERSATFGQPTSNVLTAYQPRMMQLGLRASF